MRMTAYDIYPDLDNPQIWQRYWHEPVNGQRVLRHVNLQTGEIVDLYNVSGSTFSLTPVIVKEDCIDG